MIDLGNEIRSSFVWTLVGACLFAAPVRGAEPSSILGANRLQDGSRMNKLPGPTGFSILASNPIVGIGIQRVGDIALDAQGNLYVTGSFEGQVKLGNLVDAWVTSTGGTDIFLAKYRPNGDLWVYRTFGSANGLNNDHGLHLAIDPVSGDVVLAANVEGHVSFGGAGFGHFGTAIAKFDASLNHIWSLPVSELQFQSPVNQGRDLKADRLAVSPSQEIFLTTKFEFWSEGATRMSSSDWELDTMILKYSSAGDLLYAYPLGVQNISLATDESGSPWLAGSFRGLKRFGVSGLVSSNGNVPDAFLGRLASNEPVYYTDNVLDIGGSGFDGSSDLAVRSTPDHQAVVLGQFENTVDFGGVELSAVPYDPDFPTASDIFLAKYVGVPGQPGRMQLSWAKSFGAEYVDLGAAVAEDTSGTIVMAGIYQGLVDFGCGEFQSSLNFNQGDIVIAKYSAAGDVIGAVDIDGSSTNNVVTDVVVDGSGAIWIAGTFENQMSLPTGGVILGQGGEDIYLLKVQLTGCGTRAVQ